MRKSSDIVTRKVADHTILLPLRPNSAGLWVYELNETAAFLWSLLDTCDDAKELSHRLAEEFTITVRDAEGDIREFVDQLHSLGALLKEDSRPREEINLR